MYPICAAEEKATIVVSRRAAMAETGRFVGPDLPQQGQPAAKGHLARAGQQPILRRAHVGAPGRQQALLPGFVQPGSL